MILKRRPQVASVLRSGVHVSIANHREDRSVHDSSLCPAHLIMGCEFVDSTYSTRTPILFQCETLSPQQRHSAIFSILRHNGTWNTGTNVRS